jgi:hypothetical protein
MDGQPVDQTDSQRFGGFSGRLRKVTRRDNPCVVATVNLFSGFEPQYNVIADILLPSFALIHVTSLILP